MLVTPPPDTLGAANVAGVLTAFLALLAASAFGLLLWALDRLFHWSNISSLAGISGASGVLMTPLEVDLAAVETLPCVQVAPVLDATDATLGATDVFGEPLEIAALSATLPAVRSVTPPDAPSAVPPVGSSLAVLDPNDDHHDDDDADASWPPRRPGVKRYRYVCVMGQLVRLADLRPLGIREPRWFELN